MIGIIACPESNEGAYDAGEAAAAQYGRSADRMQKLAIMAFLFLDFDLGNWTTDWEDRFEREYRLEGWGQPD